jgi:hypothetical protein
LKIPTCMQKPNQCVTQHLDEFNSSPYFSNNLAKMNAWGLQSTLVTCQFHTSNWPVTLVHAYKQHTGEIKRGKNDSPTSLQTVNLNMTLQSRKMFEVFLRAIIMWSTKGSDYWDLSAFQVLWIPRVKINMCTLFCRQTVLDNRGRPINFKRPQVHNIFM